MAMSTETQVLVVVVVVVAGEEAVVD